MLPVIDGLQVCRELRSDPKTQGIRILMLTASSEEVDEIVGFNMGADDYVTKPFKLKPLIHRDQGPACDGRTPPGSANDRVAASGIEIDRVNHLVKVDGSEVALTPTEFRILWVLARQPGRPFTRNELLDNCRGEDANALARTIDVHIRSLRQKLRKRAKTSKRSAASATASAARNSRDRPAESDSDGQQLLDAIRRRFATAPRDTD